MVYQVQVNFGAFSEIVFESDSFNEVQDFITNRVQKYIEAERDSDEELSSEALEELEELFLNDFYVKEIKN